MEPPYRSTGQDSTSHQKLNTQGIRERPPIISFDQGENEARRPRTSNLENKRSDAKDAFKKRQLCLLSNRLSFVYVGNLDSSISEKRLEEYFALCGKVTRVQVRCSRGQAVNIGVPVPHDVRTRRDSQYASIEFKDHKAVVRALGLDGTMLDGCKLVVSLSVAKLPEAQDIVELRISELRW
ncbi:hypothetical protein AMATHDRAFT_40218 [Amanita thiersii Skay4041]|uniref:RRM domain-containing protein n=1 Tax=Amanita thiersii Skay4041 TaxID=703135 RepID=A0A2A9NLN9_9AGAR|nr:hypothetical protein AMATHDRAFT_40218 [Amanita thiersii Skay4041]